MSGKVERVCEYCDSPFQTYLSEVQRGGGKFCSTGCYHASQLNRVECICQYCGGAFSVTQSAFNDGRGKYCSQNCCDKNRFSIHTCESCSKEFRIWRNQAKKRSGKYCSKKCRGQGMSNKVDVPCQQCGEIFKVTPSRLAKNGGKFCSYRCHGKWKRLNLVGENSATWQGGSIDYYGPNWLIQREKAIERDNYTCQYCGKEKSHKNHHVHHIQPFRSFGYIPDENDLCKQANDLSNLITLCERCHGKAEKGKIDIRHISP